MWLDSKASFSFLFPIKVREDYRCFPAGLLPPKVSFDKFECETDSNLIFELEKTWASTKWTIPGNCIPWNLLLILQRDRYSLSKNLFCCFPSNIFRTKRSSSWLISLSFYDKGMASSSLVAAEELMGIVDLYVCRRVESPADLILENPKWIWWVSSSESLSLYSPSVSITASIGVAS